MRDKVVDKIINKISKKNPKLDSVKLAEIKYGLQAIYTLITKTTLISILAIIFNIFVEFIIFFIFYSILRSVGFGTHAKSNIQCWIFSTLLLLGLPLLFTKLTLNITIKIILWVLLFINFLIFSPADTKKRPMINIIRKLKFKFVVLIICIIYLILILNFNNIANLIIAAMFLEGFLVNPIGYIAMGEQVRFRLNDLYIFKQN